MKWKVLIYFYCEDLQERSARYEGDKDSFRLFCRSKSSSLNKIQFELQYQEPGIYCELENRFLDWDFKIALI